MKMKNITHKQHTVDRHPPVRPFTNQGLDRIDVSYHSMFIQIMSEDCNDFYSFGEFTS